jgi:hypothetical protein
MSVERHAPTYADLSRAIDGEWCGLPMPLPGLGLVVEDRHPHAEQIRALQQIVDGDAEPRSHACTEDAMGWTLVNQWRGRTLDGIDGTIYVMRHADGRTRWGLSPHAPARNKFLFGPFETMDAWHLETELTAMERLATLLTERMYQSYIMTGALLETSKRSGLTYMFRRLRPTVVLTPHGRRRSYFHNRGEDDDQMSILCCLCLHPLAFYQQTFCGAMCPTDDVIAHLMLMRGAEDVYWRRANQHPAIAPESGL